MAIRTTCCSLTSFAERLLAMQVNSGVLCEEYYFWCGNVVGNNAIFFQLECVRMYVLQLRGEDVYIYNE